MQALGRCRSATCRATETPCPTLTLEHLMIWVFGFLVTLGLTPIPQIHNGPQVQPDHPMYLVSLSLRPKVQPDHPTTIMTLSLNPLILVHRRVRTPITGVWMPTGTGISSGLSGSWVGKIRRM